jgi:hypothetical protein
MQAWVAEYSLFLQLPMDSMNRACASPWSVCEAHCLSLLYSRSPGEPFFNDPGEIAQRPIEVSLVVDNVVIK